jgi:hypothetical protein
MEQALTPVFKKVLKRGVYAANVHVNYQIPSKVAKNN